MVSPDQLDEIIERLRSQGIDDGTVEAKRCGRGLSNDVWETVSAFANTAGGLILCGIDENEGFAPVSHFDLDRVRDQFVEGIGDGGSVSVVAHAPHYEFSRGMIDGRPVLLIEVEELGIQEKPCYIIARGVQGGSYKRIDDKDVRLSASELYEMQSVLVPSDADGGLVPEATVDDLDSVLVAAVIDGRRRQSPRVLKGADTREQQLTRLNITNREGSVRLAGLLATGIYPQQYYPKLVIDVAVHPGTAKSEPGAPRFLDRQICDGSLSACIEDALAAIGRNVRTISYVIGAGRRDEWEVPEEALREALANAVIHREYAPMFLGQAVSVDIYSDRIEVTSPGGLWGGKTLDTLEDGESRCRNAKLMALMGAVPFERAAGFVAESQGSGISAMIREMESRSLGRPHFVAKHDSFTVIFARHGAALERNRTWIAQHTGVVPDRREVTMLALLRNREQPLTIPEIRAALGWDSDDIRDVCSQLEAQGLLSKNVEGGYAVVEDAPSPQRQRGTTDELREAMVAYMEAGKTYSAHELATALDTPVSRIRYALPKLLKDKKVVATAGAHSRNRRYELGRS